MKKVIFTYLIVSMLGVSSITSTASSLDGTSDMVMQTATFEVCDMDILCADLLDISFSNSAVSVYFETVPTELPVFNSFYIRSKNLRFSPISRTCTGFTAALKV